MLPSLPAAVRGCAPCTELCISERVEPSSDFEPRGRAPERFLPRRAALMGGGRGGAAGTSAPPGGAGSGQDGAAGRSRQRWPERDRDREWDQEREAGAGGRRSRAGLSGAERSRSGAARGQERSPPLPTAPRRLGPLRGPLAAWRGKRAAPQRWAPPEPLSHFPEP